MKLERTHVTWAELRVGLLVLITAAILVTILFYINKTGLFTEAITIHSFLPDARGLEAGDPVRLAGIEIGTIQQIGIADISHEAPVQVALSISRSAAQHIHTDGSIEAHGAGLTPTQHIEIHPGTADAPQITDGDHLPGSIDAGLEGAVASIEKTLTDVQDVLNQSSRLLARFNSGEGTLGHLLTDDTLYLQLGETVSRSTALLDQVQNPEHTVGRLVHDGRIADSIERTLDSIETFSSQLTNRGSEVAASDQPLGRQIDQTLSRWAELADSLQTSRKELDELLTRLNRAANQLSRLDNTAGRLLQTPELHDEVVAAAHQTSETLSTARTGEGALGRLMSDPKLADTLSHGVEATAQFAEKLNTPGSTLDRLTSEGNMYEQLTTALDSLNVILTQIQEGKGTAGMLANDELFPEQLRQFIQDFQRLVDDIQAHPDRYLHLSLF